MDDLAPTPLSDTTDAEYRVLARKYRPATFEDLVGQEPMVQTLRNAFETGRIAQAWMLTGVRGVGKTTTARILARGLNYEIPGEVDRPTVQLDKPGVHCEAIMNGRHVDVIEMDAASHTGIDDIREITEAARYRPASARYKIYIIDEVHMLSKSAFNGLLKTLEEPPEHVKFIFATTEIRKVPVTVLSRCQRFDLRRIDADDLVGLLSRIAQSEEMAVSGEALALIARAGEGSARDSLSLLDQAMAHGAGTHGETEISAETVRSMLGLADRARVIDLFTHLMQGDAAAAMAEFKAQYAVGADPVVVLSDLAEFTHLVTRLKIVPKAGEEASVTETERLRGRELADKLSLRLLSRSWQILLKGIAEVQAAPKPNLAADMVLVRLAYAADLPDPEEALRLLRDGKASDLAAALPETPGASSGGGASAEVQASAPPPASVPASAAAPPPAAAPTVERKAPQSAPGQDGAPVPGARRLQALAGGAGGSAPASRAVPRAVPDPEPAVALASLADCAALAAEKRDIRLKVEIERQMRLVQFEPGRIEFQPTPEADPDLAGRLGRTLSEWTGMRWIVTVSRTQGRPTLFEEREANKHQLLSDARSEPTVAALLSVFPGAKVVNVRIQEAEDAEPPLDMAPDDDETDTDM
ncbi:DNA polymerase III subunit gamma/tau [Stappia sp. ES.058]|uniref:DNA polymerase III subunit gamma/tau n=1 Tax=Stappia sp. ES.058 TaxID=1881061 RepID=UPI00087D7512|nr:DNA polymerase III subunit gamma/tau [Stappia sp. ES.058]SDU46821.1 DNA polymerase-3 subunit gamma/tau [Stappia sp. ES.058]